MILKDGFYPALGTPLDNEGNLIEESMRVQVELMAEAGASGYLALGTMGQQPCIKDLEFARTARSVVEAVSGHAPVFVGCMDNSLARIKGRLDALKDVKADGVVITTPYYFISPESDMINFFKNACKMSKFPVYLYDLPATTKIKITYSLVSKLMHIPNLAGIKGGDLVLMRDILMRGDVREDFNLLFSGLELFDVAYGYGLTKQLDGFYCCIPKLTKRFYRALAAGDKAGSAKALNEINDLRNALFGLGIFPAFTAGMNALGCKGTFHPDYMLPLDSESTEKAIAKFHELGEI